MTVACGCPWCGAAEKSINHMILLYPPALQAWDLSVIPSSREIFQTISLYANFNHMILRSQDLEFDEVLMFFFFHGLYWTDCSPIDRYFSCTNEWSWMLDHVGKRERWRFLGRNLHQKDRNAEINPLDTSMAVWLFLASRTDVFFFFKWQCRKSY